MTGKLTVPMTPAQKNKSSLKSHYAGPLDWRHLVHWLHTDGMITEQEAARTVARCAQAESA